MVLVHISTPNKLLTITIFELHPDLILSLLNLLLSGHGMDM